MPKKTSYGLLMYRKTNGFVEVFLVHHGGPFFRHKENGSWSIAGGTPNGDPEPIQTAIREFIEETGVTPREPYIPLDRVTYTSGKTVCAWAFEARELPEHFSSNTFEVEWPPHSGKKQTYPEIEKWEFFTLEIAREKMLPSQVPFLERLEKFLQK